MGAFFDTIGNATIICYDRTPVLVTDPWVSDSAYFGSWTLSYSIPQEQMEAIRECKFVWFSHGHPDHLNSDSLHMIDIKRKKILLPDHVGGRIRRSLEQEGYDVQVLQDRAWCRLSDRIKVLCVADYNQDAILLIDINGRLIVNLNDAHEAGWGRFVRKIIRQYPTSFLLALTGLSDADMNNFYDEEGRLVSPLAGAKKFPVGKMVAERTEGYGTKFFIPFSSMHKYQRKDSVWANEYRTMLDDYSIGFKSKTSHLLPAFIRYNCINDTLEEINPPEAPDVVLDPKLFGDDWGELLDSDELVVAQNYFRSIEHLAEFIDFINLRVGDKDNIIELTKKTFNRGVTFEAPSNSLMTAIKYEVFDDMLIGNFMKATLHGKWPASRLYPHFSPYVAKYADNGCAKSSEDLDRYFCEYRRRAPIDFLRHRFEKNAVNIFRSYLAVESTVGQFARHVYRKWLPG